VRSSPWQLVTLFLFLGSFCVYSAIRDLSSDVVNLPSRGRHLFELLNAVFGTIHSDDYFFIATGIYLIYYGLFKIKTNKDIS